MPQAIESSNSTSSSGVIDWAYLFSEWKQMLRPATLPKDLWAGITVALVALPLNLALAIAAGVAPVVGITTGIVAGVVGAFFGGQRFGITGPAAAMAVVLIEIAEGYGIHAIWMVCLISGLLQLMAGFLRLGKLMSYIPMPVIVGFANAIGVLIFFNALHEFLGIPVNIAHPEHGPVGSALEFLPKFILNFNKIIQCSIAGEVNAAAVGVGAVALAIAYLIPKFTKAIPGPLAAIVVSTLLANLLHLPVRTIADISSVPNALPTFMVPHLPWGSLVVLFPTCIAIFLLASLESLLSASVADGMTGSTKHKSNQELIGQGLANMLVPFFGGIPVTGVIARTAVNIRSGAQTRLAGVIHSVVLLGLCAFGSQYVQLIPLAALSSILMLTGLRLIEREAFRQIWLGSHWEGYVALATSLVAVVVDVTAGVFAGLILSCILFIRQMSELSLVDEAEQPKLLEDMPSCKFVRTYVVDGPLFFGAAERFIENIIILDTVKIMILHMRAARVLDLTGAETLLSIQKQLQKVGGRLVLAEVPGRSLQLLERTGALEKLGRENFYTDYRQALISANKEMLDGTCKGCLGRGEQAATASQLAQSHAHAHSDCQLHAALLQPSSAASRAYRGGVDIAVLPEKLLGMEWMFQVDQEEDIPACLKGTPIEVLLREQNLGHAFETESAHPELVIGMCIDFRKQLSVPKDWAYIIRREGANMDGSEFAIALGLSKGIRYMALIAHNDCAMANAAEHQDGFVKALVGKYGWSPKKALDFFIEHARSKDIGNEVDFVLEEAARIERLFPGITVVPLLMRVENDKLYLIYDWLAKHDPELLGKKREAIVDTGHFSPIKFDR